MFSGPSDPECMPTTYAAIFENNRGKKESRANSVKISFIGIVRKEADDDDDAFYIQVCNSENNK